MWSSNDWKTQSGWCVRVSVYHCGRMAVKDGTHGSIEQHPRATTGAELLNFPKR
jgi:ABC-type antimicrobial peptide transport system ATPase subunit